MVGHRRSGPADTGRDVEQLLTLVGGVGKEPTINGDVKYQVRRRRECASGARTLDARRAPSLLLRNGIPREQEESLNVASQLRTDDRQGHGVRYGGAVGASRARAPSTSSSDTSLEYSDSGELSGAELEREIRRLGEDPAAIDCRNVDQPSRRIERHRHPVVPPANSRRNPHRLLGISGAPVLDRAALGIDTAGPTQVHERLR